MAAAAGGEDLGQKGHLQRKGDLHPERKPEKLCATAQPLHAGESGECHESGAGQGQGRMGAFGKDAAEHGGGRVQNTGRGAGGQGPAAADAGGGVREAAGGCGRTDREDRADAAAQRRLYRAGSTGRDLAAGGAGKAHGRSHRQGVCKRGLHHQQRRGTEDPCVVQGCGEDTDRVL